LKGNMLNMTDNVHPYHWDAQKFEAFIDLAPENEFDLIAPVAIYFLADDRLKARAQQAWKQLRKLKHPVSEGCTPKEMVESRLPPDGIHKRYKALFMHLCKQGWPDATFDQDPWGALVVTSVEHDDTSSGDAQGQFPWFTSAEALKQRLCADEETA
jgi:hypothetical protein